MTNRIELNWDVPYAVDEYRYYCSETPIDPANLPVPKAILAGDVRSYVDAAVEVEKAYYVCISSVKNGIEKISQQKLVSTKQYYVRVFMSTDSVLGFGSNQQLMADSINGGLTIGSLSQNISNVFQLTDSPNIVDFTAEFEITRLVGSGSDASVGLMFRTSNWSSDGISTGGILVAISATRIILAKGTNSTSGVETEIPGVSYTFDLNVKYKVKIVVNGSTLTVYINDLSVVTKTIDVNVAGSFGFRSWSSSSGVSSKIENLRISKN